MVHDRVRFDYGFKPYKCGECGLVFLYPYFSPEEQNKFYNKGLFASMFDNETNEELFNRCLLESTHRVDRFKDLLRKGDTILEFGCSVGHFLYAARDHVKKVCGVELGDQRRQHARNLGIDARKNIDDFQKGEFDSIFLFHVLEHLLDPIGLLGQLSEYLKKDGKLIVEVPNIEDILVSKYNIKEFKDLYYSVPHKFYFSKDTLRGVFVRAGLRCEVVPHQRYDISNHFCWMLYGKPGGIGYFKDIFSEELNAEYIACLKSKFICDTIVAIGGRDGE